MKSHKAISLIELIIVVTVFMILIGYAVPQMTRMLFDNQIEVASQELVHVLRKAQAQSTLQLNDSAWGVHLEDSTTDSFVLFQGTTYSGSTNQTIYLLPSSVNFGTITINPSGSEIVFNQVTGETTNWGSIIIGANDTGETRTITINDKGNVSTN